ncbi:MAG TPA: efflux RND transporter periplasmic adaptor subunit [Stellaceae bacterium]|nr:efflux RND transporter periplasmic adaptor subunit [Stellaceae bacterium]
MRLIVGVLLGLLLVARAASAQAPSVIVAPVQQEQIADTSDFVGRVTAIDKVEIVARVPGFIEQRLFTEGQLVKKGDLLFRIEQDTYKAAVEQQEANLAKAKAVELNAAQQLARGKALLPKDFVPKSQVDVQVAAQQSAAADVLEAQAALDQAKINLAYTEIRAPIDGRIGRVTFTVGNLVGPNTGSLATIVSFDPIYVLFQASGRDVLDFKRRLLATGPENGRVTVHVRLPDGKMYPQPGQADFLDIQADPSTDSVAVRAKFPNKDALLVPGGVVGVSIQRGAPRAALVIPESAVQLDQAGTYVLVVDAANKVELRRFKIASERNGTIVVADGLKAGERVIVEGMQKVRPGLTVAPTLSQGR